MSQEPPSLSFQVIQDALDKLIIATGNRLEREWPRRLSDCDHAAVVLRSLVYVSGNTYRTILYFSAEKPSDPVRRLEYVASIPPLARTILDGLFSVVFLFESLQERATWYHRSGWREMAEEERRLRAKYGDNPQWVDWLEEHSRFLAHTQREWQITDEEATDHRLIKYWPHPGGMLKGDHISERNRSFLTQLNDVFYRKLSSASHLSWPGLAQRSQFFFFERDDDAKRDSLLEKYRSDYVTTTVMLLVSLLSEIELNLSLGLRERLEFVWGFLKTYADDAREIHEQRYSALGSQQAEP